ncbi:unnamed protein product [Vicia faba]|uniref:Uncharacterized protein n=1 Tax=Vicia faba TaxID=3906 RepID=A0AAV1B5U7_VICFA|nr:unnamed protein product [Vicia faba]
MDKLKQSATRHQRDERFEDKAYLSETSTVLLKCGEDDEKTDTRLHRIQVRILNLLFPFLLFFFAYFFAATYALTPLSSTNEFKYKPVYFLTLSLTFNSSFLYLYSHFYRLLLQTRNDVVEQR